MTWCRDRALLAKKGELDSCICLSRDMLLDFIGLSTVVWGRCRRLTAALKIVWSQHHRAAPSSSINTPAWADLEPCKSRLDDWSRLRVNVHVMQDSHAHMLPVCRTHSCKRSPEPGAGTCLLVQDSWHD